jgi:hypothetical protein
MVTVALAVPILKAGEAVSVIKSRLVPAARAGDQGGIVVLPLPVNRPEIAQTTAPSCSRDTSTSACTGFTSANPAPPS